MKRPLASILIGGLTVIFLSCFWFYWFFMRVPTSGGKGMEVATSIGYTEDHLLLTAAYCWEVLNAHCGEHVIYTSDESLDEFNQRMIQRGWGAGESFGYPGSDIFTTINRSTPHRLTVDGKDNIALKDNLPLGAIPKVQSWTRKREDGRWTLIRLYQTSGTGVVYEFDGKPLQGNIVDVLYTTR